MLKLIQKQEVIQMSVRDGKSHRAIERETGISRKTVSKYINEYQDQRAQLLGANPGHDLHVLMDDIVSAPKYNTENRRKRKVTDEVVNAIKAHLKENLYSPLMKLDKSYLCDRV